MLTTDLLLYTRRKGRIHPRLLDPGDALLVQGAGGMIQLVEPIWAGAGETWSRCCGDFP